MTGQSTNLRRVRVAELQELTSRIFQGVAVPEDEANLLAETLVRADIQGIHSHGVLRVPQYLRKVRAGGFKPGKKGKIIHETASTVLLDGETGLGQVISVRAMELAIKKAMQSGIGATGVTNSNHHGQSGYYALMAARRDMIGLVTSNGSPSTPVWGGLNPKMTGPWPLAIAAPAGDSLPVVLDMSLGVVSKGKIQYAADTGQTIPLEWGFDCQGRPTDDPQKVLDGGWSTFIGGYKGWGLLLMIEILTGVLTGGRIGNEITNLFTGELASPQGLGHFMMAVNIEAFGPKEAFKKRMDSMIQTIKGSELAPGFEEIVLPGEPEFRREQEHMKNGILLGEKVIGHLMVLAKELRIPDDAIDAIFC